MSSKIFSDSKYYEFLSTVSKQAGIELRQRFRTKLVVSAKEDQSIVTDADLASERIVLDQIRANFPEDEILSEESGTTRAKAGHEAEYVWIVDPLDGTTNFANGYPFFSVSIGRCKRQRDGQLVPVAGAVYDVMQDTLYFAELGFGAYANETKLAVTTQRDFASSFLVTGFYYQQGEELDREVVRFNRVAQRCPSIRRDGSAALDLALVASGVFDAFWENGLKPWDIAAGILLVTEAGGKLANYGEKSFDIMNPGLIAGAPATVKQIKALL